MRKDAIARARAYGGVLGRVRLLAVVLLAIGGVAVSAATHPLDPLSFKEYWQALEVLRGAGKLDEHTRFSLFGLREPAKREVLRWRPGKAIPRMAYALARQGKAAFAASRGGPAAAPP